ncbi:MAG: D-glycero-beta-D-manno-heptose-7-phosphate kinase [Acidobacteria bacterium]|nr:D-glycero-beta-D-manno-heptose-7-phosphate kinase [Acidobacteriota bacterium]
MGKLDRFSDKKILVVGDVMLDRYWWGDVTRISPEAPVPVVRITNDTFAAGGAANVAANIAGLGATPILIGIVGDDPEAKELSTALEKQSVSSSFLSSSGTRSTIVKTRIVAHGQHVVRVDREMITPLSENEQAAITDVFSSHIDSADALLISDYNKGLLTGNLLSDLIALAKDRDIPVFADPKGLDYSKYAGATMITPNRREAIEACSLNEGGDDVVELAGKMLLDSAGVENVLITQGEKGMTLFRRSGHPFHLQATAVETYDVTGAGDTVIATLTVARSSDFTLEQSSALANIAAGHVVQQVGTSIIYRDELEKLFAESLDDQTSEIALTFAV